MQHGAPESAGSSRKKTYRIDRKRKRGEERTVTAKNSMDSEGVKIGTDRVKTTREMTEEQGQKDTEQC